MIVLGIETSCDETAAALVRGGREILSSVVSSQADVHARFGGVVPEIAFRCHTETVSAVIDEALQRADIAWGDIDAVAVTNRPGLVGALLIGVTAAKAIAFTRRIPLVAVDHIHGHIYANCLAHPALEYPFLSLIVSGGHTAIYHSDSPLQHRLLGQTLDDAAGEAYDKIANLFQLGYPGGPRVDKLAQGGNAARYAFPRSLVEEERIAFSFSGLKTAVLYEVKGFNSRLLQGGKPVLPEHELRDLLASFQEAVAQTLVAKTLQAAAREGVSRIAVGGGVAANSRLRALMQEQCERRRLQCFIAPLSLCTDNAAMIAGLGYHRVQAGLHESIGALDAYPRQAEGA